MPRKKKKKSDTDVWLVGLIAVLLLLLVGIGVIFLTQQQENSNNIVNDPAVTPTFDTRHLSSYAPTFMIYRMENRIYRMNMDSLESEQIAIVRGIASDDWQTLSTVSISSQLNHLYYSVQLSPNQHVRYKQDIATGQVWEVATYNPNEVRVVSSENGNSLLYSIGDDHDILDENAQTDEFLMFDAWHARDIAWAANGSHMMFAVLPNDSDTHFVYREINPLRTVQPEPQRDILATIAEDFTAEKIQLSPDDIYIAMNGFATIGEQSLGLWVLTRGKQEHPTFLSLTSDYVGDFSWSPDSQWIAYAGYQSNQYDILVVNVKTGEIRNLTQTVDTDEHNPQWMPNGDIIFKRDGQLWRGGLNIQPEALPNTQNAAYMGYRFGY